MECPACQRENRPGARFCNACGAALAPACPGCGQENPPGSRFCDACGTRLDAPAHAPPAREAAPASRAPEPRAEEGERRQLTVMFCDLADSTEIAGGLDAETWRELVRAYQEACESVVRRVDAHVAQYLGDGVLVYFGYPHAHEDDAQRAVLAGLEIPQALVPLAERAERDHGVPLAVRIGIHTGPVVVGTMGGGRRRETLAVGDTTNVAARLQGLAQPNAVVMSEATRRLVQGLFVTEDLGPRELKGVAEPVHAHAALRRTGVRSRLDVAGAGGLAPLVGRERELGLLLDRWEQVVEGRGQVVVVSGEAGIGKSRILQALRTELASARHTWLEFRASLHAQDSAFHPIIELLDQALALSGYDSPEERVQRLERGLGQAGLDLSEAVPLLTSLLSLPLPEGYAPPAGSPERRRRRTLGVLLEWMLRLAHAQPLVLLAEDVHWSDPSSLELLSLLVEQVPTASMLLLATHRPGFEVPWPSRTHVTPLVLGRLTRRHGAELVAHTAGGRELPGPLVSRILERTDGVPLFLEEVTKSVLESGALEKEEGAALSVPETLQDSLMARLDRLSSVREVAQLCATLGREFPYTLLQAVSPLEEGELQRGLQRLVGAEILYQRGLPPEATYVFKHALVQETAYGSLLRARRRQFHHKIATTLSERFPRIAETQPEWIAQHASEAGLAKLAVEHWHQAGQRAIERSANVEAIRHLSRGLGELASLPEGPARTVRELGLLTLRGVALIASEGFSSDPVKENFARARALCDALGQAAPLPVTYGLFTFHAARSDRDESEALAEDLLGTARAGEDAGALAQAHSANAVTAFFAARFEEVQAHAEAVHRHYDPVRHASLAYVYGIDATASARSYSAFAHWFQGRPDRGLSEMKQALQRAEEVGHAFTFAFVVCWAACFFVYRREPETVLPYARRCIEISSEQVFPFLLASAICLEAYGLGWTEGLEVAEPRAWEGLRTYEELGTRSFLPLILCELASLLASEGRVEEAKGVNSTAQGLSGILDRSYEAEVFRQQGELTWRREGAGVPEVETCLERALAVAREQGARMLELRAAASLARLRREQGHPAAGRALLAPVYEGFTEGFDTLDLREAQALLDELG